LAKKAENISTAGSNRICSDGRSGENNGGNGVPSTEGRGCSKKPICHRCGWIEERIGIVTTVEDLDIWQEIVGIGEQV